MALSRRRGCYPGFSRHRKGERDVRASLFLLCFAAFGGTSLLAAPAAADEKELWDPTRPVMRLGRDKATLQWFTRTPCASRLQLRRSEYPANTRTKGPNTADPWAARDVRIVEGPSGLRTHHIVEVTNLRPATRYGYRVFDPDTKPSETDRRWSAQPPWRREFSFSTLAAPGKKTLIRVPVKVLLMPNVIDVASAYEGGNLVAAIPVRLGPGEIDRIRREYDDAARFLFINNGMRVWFDFRIVLDERWQRWGPEPAGAHPFFKGWPVCRSYPGKDFEPPGGGTFTFVDMEKPEAPSAAPVLEKEAYPGQIEQAFLRKWDHAARKWQFVSSGGGTYGIDEWPSGHPARSQFLGGGDTAWLVTHEFHHQLESMGAFSLADREDDRVIFDHFLKRHRTRKPDGAFDEWVWNTSWKHGEHWDGIAYFDRMLTAVQWLRLHFGETLFVVDKDDDGIPDDDMRLPFDEKRFGSDPMRASTDGVHGDLFKIQLSSWASHAPLTSSWQKEAAPRLRPNPKSPDTDADGLLDGIDPYPLYPWAPFVWYFAPVLDGADAEWKEVPLSGRAEGHGVTIEFRQAHDEAFYSAVIRLKGEWSRVNVALDGEGEGYFSTGSVYAFDIVAGKDGGAPVVRPVSGNGCPGLGWRASVSADRTAVVELQIPNRGAGLWFWDRGGREVGVAIHLTTVSGKPLSVYEPFDLFYCRMIGPPGR